MEQRKTRILYMEDDPGLAKILVKSLRRRGYEVEVAENGRIGLNRIKEEVFDLLIVDYEMPELNGIDVIRGLAQPPENPPAIMLTGAGNEGLAVTAMKAGAADYLVKDIEMSYLELLPIVMDQALFRANLFKEKEELHLKTKQSEERYRLLVDHSPDGIVIHSQGQIKFINPACIEMFRAANSNQLLDRHLLDFIHPEHKNIVLGRLQDMFHNQCKMPWIEVELVRLDGKSIDIELSSVPFIYQEKPSIQTILRDISERKQSQKKLEYLAHYDQLTNLPNRTLFFERLERSLLQAQRYKHPMALLYLDLDGFKPVNDSLGHTAGDFILQKAAERFSNCIREADTVARLGGDEFCVILTRLNGEDDAKLVAEKILKEINKPFLFQGKRLSLGVSIGISTFPHSGETAKELLNRADSSMYEVKSSGKNSYSTGKTNIGSVV